MSGPTTRVRLPNGKYVNVPTDDPTVAAAAARKHWDRVKPKGLMDTILDFNDTAIDSLLPNLGDEVRGVGRAIRAGLRGDDMGAAFREGQRSFKADQARFRRDHPTAASRASGLGMAAGLALPAGKALKGASAMRQAVQGAKVGAAYGALSGAGEGDGLDLDRRASNATTGALYGAATGVALPLATRGALATGRLARERIGVVDKAARAMGNAVRRVPQAAAGVLSGRKGNVAATSAPPRESAATLSAYREAMDHMGRGNIDRGPGVQSVPASPEAVVEELGRRQGLGVPAITGDVSAPLRDLTASTARGMGPAQSMVREKLEARKVAEGERVQRYIQDNLPTVSDPVRFVEDHRRQAQEAAAPLYREAYSQPMYRSPEIQAIEQTPAFREALPQAYRNIQNQIDPVTRAPKDPMQMGFRHVGNDPAVLPGDAPVFRLQDGSFVAVDNGLSAEGYDQVYRAMRDAGVSAANRNPVTGRIENTTNSVHINSLAGDLRDHLAAQNAAYGEAVRRYGDDMAYLDAFRQGRDVGSLTGPEIAAQQRSLPDFAHEPWATGAGTELAEETSRYSARHPYGDTSSRIRGMIGDDAKAEALGSMAGNSEGVGSLRELLDLERQQTANWRGARGGVGSIDSDGWQRVPRSASGALSQAFDYLGGLATAGARQERKSAIANVMTMDDPEALSGVLRTVQRDAERASSRRNKLHEGNLGALRLYGRAIQPEEPLYEEDYRGY